MSEHEHIKTNRISVLCHFMLFTSFQFLQSPIKPNNLNSQSCKDDSLINASLHIQVPE